MFAKEQARLEKVDQRERAWKWICSLMFFGIVFVALLLFWLKSMTERMAVNHLGDVERVRRIQAGTYRSHPELSDTKSVLVENSDGVFVINDEPVEEL